MQIDKIITDYVLSKDTDYAIMIDGEWGAGKSWYWDNVLTEQIKEIPTKDNTEGKPSMYKVAKISLFGVSSVDDLRIKIFEETSTFFANKYVKTGAKFTGMIVNKVAGIFNVSETSAKDVSDLLSEFSVNLDHYVLCFDDLERIKTELLIELLGYINTLVEHDKVKVVFICNENELKDVDYHKYKEKIVRFTHTIKADISKMVLEFAKGKEDGYSKYLCERKDYIASIYQRGNSSNLRTLKYNLDIYEQVYEIIGKTIQSENEQHVYAVANYMLLLSMVYSIEYRRDNDEAKLKSLFKINRQWIYQLDTMDSLSRQSGNNEDKQKSQAEKSEEEKIVDYQRYIKKCYFANSYIYGSSMPMIEYLLTGYCDEDAMRANIQWIEVEAKRYEASEEKQLYQELTQFWDTDDDVMANAVKRTMEKVKEGSFLLQDYPLFFLALQRLQNFSFIDLKMTIPELQEIFESAISKFENVPFVDGLDAYYYQNNGESTPEFMALVNKVIDINAHNNQKYLSAEFEVIVKNVRSSEDLNKYEHVLTCMFKNIGAECFFELFISYRNCRKRDYWNFFDGRYDSRDCFDLDREFIDNFREILSNYLSDKSIEASGTRKYCSKMLELLNKKLKQFGEQFE
jgi:KAP family P-loop domain.